MNDLPRLLPVALLICAATAGCSDDPVFFGPFPDSGGFDAGTGDSGATDTGGSDVASDLGGDATGEPEICDNLQDDDLDGRTDCLDSDCEEHEACQGAFCGDGNIDADLGEACDDGVGNSDTTPDACRSNCQLPFCGDGVVDLGEACDGGADCSDACTLASCGDGNLDPGEECDDGAGNSDTAPGACRTNCLEAFCGDNVLDTGELCDDGLENSDTERDACRRSCVPASCGDGVVDSGEACEVGVSVEGTCEDEGFDSGELGCDDTCEFDTDGCEYECDPLPVDGELDLNLRTSRWTGEVLLDGRALPSEPTPDACVSSNDEIVRGFIRVTNLDNADTLNLALGRSGRVTIDEWLPVGRYRADYLPAGGCWNSDYSEWLLPRALPRVQGAILTEFELTGDLDMDLDLRTGHWTGEVLLDGAQLPSEVTADNCVSSNDEIIRGFVRITNLDTGHSQSFGLDRTGAVEFDYWLPAGTYRADYRPAGGCWNPDYSEWLQPRSLPRVEGVIVAELDHTGDREQDLNLRTGRWTGEVLLDGRSLPNESTADDCVSSNDEILRGFVRITNLDTNDAESFALGREGAVEFDYWLPVGRYRADYAPAGGCWNPDYSEWLLPQSLPRIEGVIVSELEHDGDLDSDLDLRTGHWTGEVLLDGVRLPTESTADNCVSSNDEIVRGFIRITNLDTGDSESFNLGRAGAVNFDYWLPDGPYRVDYAPAGGCWNPDYSEWLLPESLPRIAGVLQANVVHSGDREADLNLRTGRWTGEVLLDGRRLPDEPTPDNCVSSNDEILRGVIRITNLETSDSETFSLERNGAVNFNYWLPVGPYRVDFAPAGGCWNPDYSEWLLPSALPRIDGVLEAELAHNGDRDEDLDLRTQHWTGQVLLNGARLPSESTPDNCVSSNDEIVRGFAQITNLDTGDISLFDLGRSGAVEFDYWLPKGRYRADYRPAGGCWNPDYSEWLMPQSLPRIEGVLETCREIAR